MPLADTLFAQQTRKAQPKAPNQFDAWRRSLGVAGGGRAPLMGPPTRNIQPQNTLVRRATQANLRPPTPPPGPPRRAPAENQLAQVSNRTAALVQQAAQQGVTVPSVQSLMAQQQPAAEPTVPSWLQNLTPVVGEGAVSLMAGEPMTEEYLGPAPLQPFTPAGESSLAQGFFIDPLTGERRDIDPEIAGAMQALGGEPLPGGETGNLLPDTWDRQRNTWKDTMNAMLGITPGTMPDTYFGRLNREWEQYNAGLQDTGTDWYSDGGGWWGGGGGGGGGGGEYNPQFWLNRVKWNI